MTDAEHRDADLLDVAHQYAMHALSATERRALERRLALVDRDSSAEFADAVRSIRETLAALTAVDAQAPPAELEARLLNALDEIIESADPEHISAAERLRRWLSRWEFMAAAAMLIVVLAAGGAVIANRVDRAPAGISAQLVDAQPDKLIHSVPVAGGGALVVHASARLAAATVSFDGVPEPPDGRDYQMWLVPAAGLPRSAAVLEHPAAQTLILHFDPVDTLAMTVEPSGGSTQPTTEPIASLRLV